MSWLDPEMTNLGWKGLNGLTCSWGWGSMNTGCQMTPRE